MEISTIILLFFSFLMLVPSLASITRYDQWWVRFFDFPRIQICVLIVVVLILSFWAYDFTQGWQYVMIGLVSLSLIYQLYYILPYTFLKKTQVMRYDGDSPQRHISILVSNVLTPNKHFERLIDLIGKRDPDIVLTLETDKRWERELEPIEKKYPHTVKVPQDNLYGMHLYSKLKLKDIKVKYLVQDDIPSIHGYVVMDDGTEVAIHCLHPRPPSPTESKTSTSRDAELLLVGKLLKECHYKTLVFGDLNDVAWSRTTKLFHQISGLLDPRIGRGFFNTYNAKYPLLRWPLDHAFHTEDFTLVNFSRQPSIGSDHFPVFICLNLEPKATMKQKEPEADPEEEEWAEEKIEKGQPRDYSIS